MSQYSKLSDLQYARFQILAEYFYFRLFWPAGLGYIFMMSAIQYHAIIHPMIYVQYSFILIIII